MTDATCSTRGRFERRSSHARHSVFNARAVCSTVTSGFFPPQPAGLLGGEQQDQVAQGHVPHQPPVAAALEVAEADLGLGQAEHMLDPGPRERDLQQRAQRGLGRGVGDEVLHLAGAGVAGHDQPVGPRRGPAVAGEVYLGRPHLPHLVGPASGGRVSLSSRACP